MSGSDGGVGGEGGGGGAAAQAAEAANALGRALHLDALRNLDCSGAATRAAERVRAAKFPYSIQSVKLRPVESDPALVTLTLRASGEIRIVHGNADIFNAVRKAVTVRDDGAKKEGEDVEDKKAEETKEEGKKEDEEPEQDKKGEEEKEGGEEKKDEEAEVDKKDEKSDKKDTKTAEDSAKEAKPHKDWEEENNEKNGLWRISLCPTGEGENAPSEKEKLLALCKILEGLICAGWEVLTTGEMTVTSGCELFTWILKKSTTPLEEAAVVAVAISQEQDAKVEVVATAEQPQVNNVLKQAVESVSPSEEGEAEKKEEQEGEGGEGDGNNKRKSLLSKDDPDCAAAFDLPKAFQGAGDNGTVMTSKLLLELSRLLFCRQWRLVATAPTPFSNHEVLFFCRDSRILPALGEEAFAMVALQKPDKLRLHRVSEDAEKDIRAAIVEHWPAGLESKEPDEVGSGGARQYRLLEDPWTRSRRDDGSKRPMVAAQVLAANILLVLNKRQLNLYAKVCLRRGEPDQVTLLIFRQSNVAYTETLTIQPTGLNRLAVIGASEEDLEAIRKCLKSRWPYPLTRDGKVDENEEVVDGEEKKDKEKQGQEAKDTADKDKEIEDKEKGGDEKEPKEGEKEGKDSPPNNKSETTEEKEDLNEDELKGQMVGGATLWQFKVKRYPWAVSYGNKHLDKLVDAVRVAAGEVRQAPDIPEPANMDAESAKSVLAFLLKVSLEYHGLVLEVIEYAQDLGELGWRLQTSADVCSSKVQYPRTRLPERRSDANALFLLR